MVRKVNKEGEQIVLLDKLVVLQKSPIRQTTATPKIISQPAQQFITENFKFLKNGLLIELLELFYCVLET
jgi:hypothetical protein